jgi:hypothetical protein
MAAAIGSVRVNPTESESARPGVFSQVRNFFVPPAESVRIRVARPRRRGARRIDAGESSPARLCRRPTISPGNTMVRSKWPEWRCVLSLLRGLAFSAGRRGTGCGPVRRRDMTHGDPGDAEMIVALAREGVEVHEIREGATARMPHIGRAGDIGCRRGGAGAGDRPGVCGVRTGGEAGDVGVAADRWELLYPTPEGAPE